MQTKVNNLHNFFKENNKVAIAFSGGTDSVYLLYEAVKSGADVTAYYVNSAFQPEFELNNARKIAEQTGAKLKIIDVDVLSNETIRNNPSNRCYYCKQIIMSTIKKVAKQDGYDILLDGTNASDDAGDRPGMKALVEMDVKSPLRLAGLTKDMIREMSKRAGLFTWDMPAYACLATRIGQNEVITTEKLQCVEKSEDFLRALGFSDLRVRVNNDVAKIQLKENQFDLFFNNREQITTEFKKYFKTTVLDLMPR